MRCSLIFPAIALAMFATMARADTPKVGQKAPEIEGKDIKGKDLKLSDFRGKVVVLDFFGDW